MTAAKLRFGFTLVELMVVISIITLLLSLLIAAVHSARETARQNSCQGNLRQLGVAVSNHIAAHGTFPTGGWGWTWLGSPDRGYGRRQPGGWAYNVLDFMESRNIRSAGSGPPSRANSKMIASRCGEPISTFVCPSRRDVLSHVQHQEASPLATNDVYRVPVIRAARSDYACNFGDRGISVLGEAPKSLSDVDSGRFRFPDTKHTGVIFLRSQVGPGQVSGGMSKTYLIGEKSLAPEDYLSGWNPGDNENLYVGFDHDNGRLALETPRRDGRMSSHTSFGSVHRAGWFVLLCDGSASLSSYDINWRVHKQLANRHD